MCVVVVETPPSQPPSLPKSQQSQLISYTTTAADSRFQEQDFSTPPFPLHGRGKGREKSIVRLVGNSWGFFFFAHNATEKGKVFSRPPPTRPKKPRKCLALPPPPSTYDHWHLARKISYGRRRRRKRRKRYGGLGPFFPSSQATPHERGGGPFPLFIFFPLLVSKVKGRPRVCPSYKNDQHILPFLASLTCMTKLVQRRPRILFLGI